jgi:dGTPase
MVKSLIEESQEGKIGMSEEVLEATNALRNYLFDEVYMRDEIHGEIQKGEGVLEALFHYLMKHPEEVGETSRQGVPTAEIEQEPLERRVVDFIAGMTDRYALDFYERIFLPRPWKLS